MPTNTKHLILAIFLAFFLIWTALLTLSPTSGAHTTASPLSLELISHQDAASFADMVRDGDYLYTMDYQGGRLRVFDIRQAAFPEELASTTVNGGEITIEGNYLYTFGGHYLRVVDISDPVNPILVATYNDFEQYQGIDPFVSYVAARGHIVYVTLNYSGDWCTIYGKVAVLDVSDPANPVRVGTILSGGLGGVGRLATWKDNLYILLGSEMLRYDVSDPANPVFSGAIDFGYVHHAGGDFFVKDDRVFLSYYAFGNPCYVTGLAGFFVVDPATLEPIRIQHGGAEPRLYDYSDGYLYAYAGYAYPYGFYLMSTPAFDAPVMTDPNFAPAHLALKDGFVIAHPVEDYHSYGLDTFRLSADSVAVGPGQAGELVYTDTLGLVTSLQLGAGAVLSPTVVSVLPLPPAGGQLPGWLARQVFDLAGYLPDDRQVLTGFQEPVTATLPYSPTTFPQGWWVGWWNGHSWVDAGSTCPTDRPTDRSTDRSTDLSNLGDLTNLIQQPLCAVGKYALFFDPYEAFLPRVRR
ncbi:MAG: hypothetical protein H6666_12610 [Ardenticatenaceae bacterium]|nr:hypothetical protein [Ardenticatenaceae bacterium]